MKYSQASDGKSGNSELPYSHDYVTHEDFESIGILTICSPLHPLRGSFPRRGTRGKSAAFGRQKEKSPLERGDAEGRGEDLWVK